MQIPIHSSATFWWTTSIYTQKSNWTVWRPTIWPHRGHLLHYLPILTLEHYLSLLFVLISQLLSSWSLVSYNPICSSLLASAYCFSAFNFPFCIYYMSRGNPLLPSKFIAFTALELHSTFNGLNFYWHRNYRQLHFFFLRPITAQSYYSSSFVPFFLFFVGIAVGQLVRCCFSQHIHRKAAGSHSRWKRDEKF